MTELATFGPWVGSTIVLLAVWRYIVAPELKAAREHGKETLKLMAQAAASSQATAEVFERVVAKLDKSEGPKLRIAEKGQHQ